MHKVKLLNDKMEDTIMKKIYIQPMIETMPVRFIEMICDTSAYVPVSDKTFSNESEVF